jgi:hypothetical protein
VTAIADVVSAFTTAYAAVGTVCYNEYSILVGLSGQNLMNTIGAVRDMVHRHRKIIVAGNRALLAVRESASTALLPALTRLHRIVAGRRSRNVAIHIQDTFVACSRAVTSMITVYTTVVRRYALPRDKRAVPAAGYAGFCAESSLTVLAQASHTGKRGHIGIHSATHSLLRVFVDPTRVTRGIQGPNSVIHRLVKTATRVLNDAAPFVDDTVAERTKNNHYAVPSLATNAAAMSIRLLASLFGTSLPPVGAGTNPWVAYAAVQLCTEHASPLAAALTRLFSSICAFGTVHARSPHWAGINHETEYGLNTVGVAFAMTAIACIGIDVRAAGPAVMLTPRPMSQSPTFHVLRPAETVHDLPQLSILGAGDCFDFYSHVSTHQTGRLIELDAALQSHIIANTEAWVLCSREESLSPSWAARAEGRIFLIGGAQRPGHPAICLPPGLLYSLTRLIVNSHVRTLANSQLAGFLAVVVRSIGGVHVPSVAGDLDYVHTIARSALKNTPSQHPLLALERCLAHVMPLYYSQPPDHPTGFAVTAVTCCGHLQGSSKRSNYASVPFRTPSLYRSRCLQYTVVKLGNSQESRLPWIDEPRQTWARPSPIYDTLEPVTVRTRKYRPSSVSSRRLPTITVPLWGYVVDHRRPKRAAILDGAAHAREDFYERATTYVSQLDNMAGNKRLKRTRVVVCAIYGLHLEERLARSTD